MNYIYTLNESHMLSGTTGRQAPHHPVGAISLTWASCNTKLASEACLMEVRIAITYITFVLS